MLSMPMPLDGRLLTLPVQSLTVVNGSKADIHGGRW
jgi:hypothetical protein